MGDPIAIVSISGEWMTAQGYGNINIKLALCVLAIMPETGRKRRRRHDRMAYYTK